MNDRLPPPRSYLLVAMLIAIVCAIGVSLLMGRSGSIERLALTVVIAGSFLFVFAAVRYPICLVFAALLYESFLNWRAVEQIQLLGFNRLLFYAVMVGTFCLAVLFVGIMRQQWVRFTFIDLCILVFMLAFSIAALFAHDREASFSAVTYLLASFAVLYSTRLTLQSQRDIHLLLAFILILMLFQALLGIGQFITGEGVLLISSESGGALFRRATGTLGNGLGWYLDVGFILASGLWYFKSGKPAGTLQNLYLPILLIIGGGLLVANTRGAWIDAMLTITLAVLLGMGSRLRAHPRRFLLLGLGGLSLLIVVLLNDSLQTRIVSIVMQLIDPAQSTVGFRFYLWEAALAMFNDSPLFGVGPDNFRILLPQFASPEAATFLRLELGRTYSPHHAGLHLLSETGLVGVITFSLVVLAYCRHAYAIWRHAARQQQATGLAAALWLLALISTAAMLYGGYAYGGYTQIGILYLILVGVTIRQHQFIRQQVSL